MSPEQVALSTKGQAPLSSGKGGDQISGRKVGNVGEQYIDGTKFRAVYYYDDEGLGQITLNGRSKDCKAVAESLITQLGEPAEINDQLLLRTITWHDRANDNRVTLLVSRSLCDVILQRL